MSQIIYLVRHGRTELNAQGALRGLLDPALDAQGRRQVAALGGLFAGVELGAVVSSPLARATETAQAIAASSQQELRIDPRLVDRDYGSWAGTSQAEAIHAYGAIDNLPGIEPHDKVVQRSLAVVTDHLVGEPDGAHPAVLVTHDAVIHAILGSDGLALVDDAAAATEPATWSRLRWIDGGFVADVVGATPGDGQWP